ncbi:ABC transporter family protein [Babesia bovis T2Bo]|uniref:ABC transporter family protein n=1 Tax=Babesia bovis TaxID=5865 RepID=A7AQ35_BABBO|nr:ABC transporter family protein [Babesia bovis T2Bo]EDO08669.1 ABC transporter family protein [Babesia bovis T2Bo]|eukprot:XP_001612237.1 ABC transporter family protein [Babesia bovis T2Bo]
MGKCPITGRGSSSEADAFRVDISDDTVRATKGDIIDMMKPFYWPGKPTDSKHKRVVLRSFVLLAVFFLFAGKACHLLAPVFLGQTVNSLKEGEGEKSLYYLLAMALLFFSGTLCDEMRNLLYSYVQCHGLTTLAETFYSHMYTMDYQWFLSAKGGEVIRCMTRGLESMRDLTRFGVLLMVPTLLEATCVCILFAAYFQDPWLTLTVIIGLILYTAVTIGATNWRNKTRRAEAERDDEMHSISNDGMNNFDTVKYFTNEKYEVDRYTEVVRQHQKCQWRVISSLSLLNISQEILKQSTVGLCLMFAVMAVKQNKMSVGQMVSIQTYLFYLYRPLFLLGTMYAAICRAVAGIQSAANMLKCQPTVVDRPDAIQISLDNGTDESMPMIQFQDVCFTFPEKVGLESKVTLKNINFALPKGKSMAIVGPTGSGKTTLSLLLCRLYDPTSGKILINGTDIADVTQESLRKNIGVVSQNTMLFHASLRENLKYAKLDATDYEIYEALRRASFLDRVMALPEKLDTVVGERGMRLSGGEKQRVSIARCFLKDPPILILDEATSALDSKTEADIQSALFMLFHNRTVITIAHRLSTIVDCDSIMYIEAGEIKEFGSHDDLMEKAGYYKSLWDAQLKATPLMSRSSTGKNERSAQSSQEQPKFNS